jgi:transcriptional regulator with XRE-family HTH domain
MNKEELVQKLKSLREERKISVNKMAQLIGTSHKRVKDVEAGNSEFFISLLLKYAAAVGYTIELQQLPREAPQTIGKIVEVRAKEIDTSKVADTTLYKKPVEPVHVVGSKKKIVIEDQDEG